MTAENEINESEIDRFHGETDRLMAVFLTLKNAVEFSHLTGEEHSLGPMFLCDQYSCKKWQEAMEQMRDSEIGYLILEQLDGR